MAIREKRKRLKRKELHRCKWDGHERVGSEERQDSPYVALPGGGKPMLNAKLHRQTPAAARDVAPPVCGEKAEGGKRAPGTRHR